MAESFTSRIAAFFRAHPGQWIDGRTLALVGGAYAWRSRVADCRRDYQMAIENRQRKVHGVVISEYRFVEQVDAAAGGAAGEAVGIPIEDGVKPDETERAAREHRK